MACFSFWRKPIIAAGLILLSGCVGLGSRKSSIEYSDGRWVKVLCQSDGRCVVKPDGTVEVDNRGPLGQVWAAGTASIGKIYDKVVKEEAVVK